MHRAALRLVLAVLALVALLSAAPGQASAATYRVTMQGYAFAPATLSVPAGSTVTWTNQDTAPHDVKTTSGPVQIHSPMLNKGESWSFTFTTAGSYAYYCTVHPNMTAGIAVQAAAPAPSAAPTHSHTHTEPTSGSGSGSGSTSEHHGTGTGTGMTHPTSSTGRTPVRTAPASAAAPKAPGRASPAPTTASAASPPSPALPVAEPAPQAQSAAVGSARPLDPLLLLTGIVAGIAVLCLLLVGSRAAAPRGRDEAEGEA
ncbi:cupredoxin domain-containing protein [Streptomyces sp. NBC_00576]|uniref:cupredoxin domain-containing protein n=1 Tax=Streptomyces sp. NBC_00576 TaxID=2903665 RepID=UPI002E81CD84|nr:plastocyanin/azurin family copper-binding protein [Streptomyces sp. NBC_00576]WUB71757.1 cupredoxin domain-containing protein [Streptomyces sp. NBC_00576]